MYHKKCKNKTLRYFFSQQILGYYGLRKDNKRSVIMENVAITIQRALNKTSWLLFMDGAQLPQG